MIHTNYETNNNNNNNKLWSKSYFLISTNNKNSYQLLDILLALKKSTRTKIYFEKL
jgi:hypothetical protein